MKHDTRQRQLYAANSRKGIAEKFGIEIFYRALLAGYKELEDDL